MKSPVSRFTVSGNSMSPSLKEDQDILSFNWFHKLKIGDMVVIKKNGKEMVKRVSKILDREKMIFVEGDNKEESTDSRDFGPVSKDKIIGKVIFSN